MTPHNGTALCRCTVSSLRTLRRPLVVQQRILAVTHRRRSCETNSRAARQRNDIAHEHCSMKLGRPLVLFMLRCSALRQAGTCLVRQRVRLSSAQVAGGGPGGGGSGNIHL